MALFRANLLVIQYLETLYLGGNHVRVVCERMWRNTQDFALQQGLATRSRGWLATSKPLKDAHEWSMQRSWTIMPTVVLQDKKSKLTIQLAHGMNSQLSQVARPSRQLALFWKTDSSHSILTQVWIPLIPMKCREFLERILKEIP